MDDNNKLINITNLVLALDNNVTDLIDTLSTSERAIVLKAVWSENQNAQVPRNLTYNYTTQEWIDYE